MNICTLDVQISAERHSFLVRRDAEKRNSLLAFSIWITLTANFPGARESSRPKTHRHRWQRVATRFSAMWIFPLTSILPLNALHILADVELISPRGYLAASMIPANHVSYSCFKSFTPCSSEASRQFDQENHFFFEQSHCHWLCSKRLETWSGWEHPHNSTPIDIEFRLRPTAPTNQINRPQHFESLPSWQFSLCRKLIAALGTCVQMLKQPCDIRPYNVSIIFDRSSSILPYFWSYIYAPPNICTLFKWKIHFRICFDKLFLSALIPATTQLNVPFIDRSFTSFTMAIYSLRQDNQFLTNLMIPSIWRLFSLDSTIYLS